MASMGQAGLASALRTGRRCMVLPRQMDSNEGTPLWGVTGGAAALNSRGLKAFACLVS